MSALMMRQQVLLCDTEGCRSFFLPLPGRHQHPAPHGKPISSGAFLVDIVTTRDRAEEAGWVTAVSTGHGSLFDLCPGCIAAAEQEARKAGGAA